MKYLIALSIILTSCTDFTDSPHYYVDPSLKPFVDEFNKEANARGFDFSAIDMTVVVKQLSTCGLTVYNLKTVYIDTTSMCWAMDRRQLVFHELGHYLLHRSHDNSLLSTNSKFQTIKSIMYADGYILNLAAHEKYYIDELFDPNTKTPYSSK